MSVLGCSTLVIYLWASFNHSETRVCSLLDKNIQLHICCNATVHSMEFMSANTLGVLHSLQNLIQQKAL